VAGRCNASQDAQDAWDAEDASLASGRNADGSDAGSVFADVLLRPKSTYVHSHLYLQQVVESEQTLLLKRFR